MRPLVEPPPSLRCMCGGELRLKLIHPADRTSGKQREIFGAQEMEGGIMASERATWMRLMAQRGSSEGAAVPRAIAQFPSMQSCHHMN